MSILFKIKRKLAEKGIGDPLITLFKTSKEIEEMEKRGEIKSGIEPSHEKNSHIRQSEKGKFGIFYIGHSKGVRGAKSKETKNELKGLRFNSESRAREWALWNYKGRTDCWRIFQEQMSKLEVIKPQCLKQQTKR